MKKIALFVFSIMLTQATLFAQEQTTATHEFEKAEAKNQDENDLLKAVSESPDDFKANYNIAVYYYNIGVEKIEDVYCGLSYEELEAFQNEVIDKFSQALPYALAAHNANTDDTHTLNMLAGIYFGLNEMEEHKKYQAELKDVLERGK